MTTPLLPSSSSSTSLPSHSLVILIHLTLIYFLENYSRSLITVSPIPYIPYNTYKYSLLTGPIYAVMYTYSGLVLSLIHTLQSIRVISLSIACFLFSSAVFFTSFTQNFWQISLLRMLMGLAQSIVTPFSCGLISYYIHPTYRGGAYSVYNFGVYVSFSVALSLGTYMYDTYGYKAGYLLFGLIGVLFAVLTPFVIPEPPDDKDCISSDCREDEDGVEVSLMGSNTHQPHRQDGMMDTLLRVLHVWRESPALYILCIGTGIRIGAGYIWSAYTAVYFSEMYVTDEEHSGKCTYSYNATYTGSGGNTCGAEYPYCFASGECKDINIFPWHNSGVSHSHLYAYMSWVPLVGSGLGSMLGGYFSDILVRSKHYGLYGRPFVAATSSVVSLPFVILALLAGYPDCFLYFIPSGLTGEMYIGASLALVADLTPVDLVVPSVALFMFIVTIIGGNATLLVPLTTSYLIPHTYHNFQFTAAPPVGSIDTSSGHSTYSYSYSVDRRSGYDLQEALLYIQCALYFLSAVVYYMSAWVLLKKRHTLSKSSSTSVERTKA